MKRLTIYDIKRAVENTSPHFFDRSSLKFFGQTMKDFKVFKQGNIYYICAPIRNRHLVVGLTERYFNPLTNELTSNP